MKKWTQRFGILAALVTAIVSVALTSLPLAFAIPVPPLPGTR
jgi:hypothetical protein